MNWRVGKRPEPHPRNAEGDFYVELGCCITCGVPLDVAPRNFEWTEEEDTHVSCIVGRQPESADELLQVLEAMDAAEVDCIRYRGHDLALARRIAEIGLSDLCDHPPPATRLVVRDRCTFVADVVAAASLAERLAAFLLAGGEANPSRYEVKPPEPRARVQFSWYESTFHTVEFGAGESPGRWMVRCRPKRAMMMRGVTAAVDAWLKSDGDFRDLRWYSAGQWSARGPWSATRI